MVGGIGETEVICYLLKAQELTALYRCGGLVVMESALHAAGPGFESQRRWYHSHLMVHTTSPYELDSRSL